MLQDVAPTPVSNYGDVDPYEIWREPTLDQITKVHRTTRWRWERAGKFPKRVRLGPNSVGWFAHEVRAWMAARARERL